MVRFIRKWMSVIFPWKHVGIMTAATKLLITVLGTGAVVGLLTFFGRLQLPWWGFVLILGAVFWGSFTAGMALEQSHGPVVEVGPLDIDSPVKIFRTLLKNGPIPVNVIGRVTAIDESIGIRHTEHAWEGHLRGRPPGFRRIEALDDPDYGWLGVARHASGNPTLFIWSNDAVLVPAKTGSGHGMIPISRDVPLDQQGIISLRLVVDCETVPDEKGKVETGTRTEAVYRIAPDPKSAVGYTVMTDFRRPNAVRRSGLYYILKALRALRPGARPQVQRRTMPTSRKLR